MHLLHVFPSFQVGGSQRRFAALANHFGQNYRHTIVSLDGCRDATVLLAQNVAYTLIDGPPKRGLLTSIRDAHRALLAEAPDLLITYNWGAMEWAAANLLTAFRHVHIEDGFGPEEASGQLRRRVLFRRGVLNIKSTLVLPSHTLVNLARKEWRISASRVLYVPNGIPCARFQREPDAEIMRGLKGSGPIIGTVATLRKEKALDRLIAAFGLLRGRQPARLVIVGDGPERASLEALAASSGLADSITFTGSISRPETVVTGFDVFALSSDTEQMPLSVLEAMASGLAIAATDVGDIRRMVTAGNHPFLTTKSPTALADAIQRLLADKDERARIGASNLARAGQEYDEATMFASYDAIFSGRA